MRQTVSDSRTKLNKGSFDSGRDDGIPQPHLTRPSMTHMHACIHACRATQTLLQGAGRKPGDLGIISSSPSKSVFLVIVGPSSPNTSGRDPFPRHPWSPPLARSSTHDIYSYVRKVFHHTSATLNEEREDRNNPRFQTWFRERRRKKREKKLMTKTTPSVRGSPPPSLIKWSSPHRVRLSIPPYLADVPMLPTYYLMALPKSMEYKKKSNAPGRVSSI